MNDIHYNKTFIGDHIRINSSLTTGSYDVIAVVILNWNSGNDILNCIYSVIASDYSALNIIVVDNGSIDGSSDVIRSQFPQVHFISNPRNFGFAAGSNQGINWALERGISYILLLNADTTIDKNAIHKLLEPMKREGDSVVTCPKIYIGPKDDNSTRLWFACGTAILWAGLFRNPAYNQPDSALWSQPAEMDFASGCCMLIPARILRQVGKLDESYFAYCEDIDFSLRVRKAGFQLRYVPSAHLWHGSIYPTERAKTRTYRYLSTRNNLWVVRKHGTRWEFLLCLGLLPFRSLYRIIGMAAIGRWSSIAGEAQGIRDGLFSDLSSR